MGSAILAGDKPRSWCANLVERAGPASARITALVVAGGTPATPAELMVWPQQ